MQTMTSWLLSPGLYAGLALQPLRLNSAAYFAPISDSPQVSISQCAALHPPKMAIALLLLRLLIHTSGRAVIKVSTRSSSCLGAET